MSVSRHPMAWRSIARLAGEIHEFDVKDNRFLDWHELSDEQKSAIDEWGVSKGYLVPTTLYKVTVWDDELDSERFMTFATEEEAESEAEDYEVEVESFESYTATDTFPDRAFIGNATDYDQVIAAVWVNEAAPELDGVWWEDNFNVSHYSAPRGVLANNKIEEWVSSSQIVDENSVDEEDEDYDEY